MTYQDSCASRVFMRPFTPRCKPTITQIQISLLISTRFEKSLYDLIRGLRNHKGREAEYIQNSLKECRAEIKGSDMG